MNLNKEQQKQLKVNLAKLPELCYGVLNSSNEIILIKRGESGYWPTDYNPAETFNKKFNSFAEARKAADEWCDELNDKLGVTKAQRKAMENGSMFGFYTLSADPDCNINNI